MIFISIIVPVYRTESFLDNCVRSLVAQTFSDIEIILIEDGSPDGCPKICDEWGKKDSRIKVIHQKNQGVTKARANGVEVAAGKWITFVDSDDTLPVDAIDNMVKAIGDNDIVVGQIGFDGPYPWPYAKIDREYNREHYIKALLGKNEIHCGPVAKLFKRSLFDDFSFNLPSTIICGEDYIMNLRLANNAKKIVVIETIVYNYFFREGSAVTKEPFSSLSYVLLFNRFVFESIRPSSFTLRLCMLSDCFRRLIVWFKQNIKRLIK